MPALPTVFNTLLVRKHYREALWIIPWDAEKPLFMY